MQFKKQIIALSFLSAISFLLQTDKQYALAEEDNNIEICFSTQETTIIKSKEVFKETNTEHILTKEEKEKLEEEQRIAEEKRKEEEKLKQEEEKKKIEVSSNKLYSIDEFEYMGIIYWNNIKFSYYSERVLPGYGLNIPGRNTSDGFVKDSEGYIVAAIAGEKNIIIDTPFGAKAKVYDYCEGCSVNQVDLYTR